MDARLSFRCSKEFVERVDAARGREPREAFLRRIVDLALSGYPITGGPTQESWDAVVTERDRLEDELRALRAVEQALDGRPGASVSLGVQLPDPAPAEQPRGVEEIMESLVSKGAFRSPSPRPRRDVKPFQRGGS